MTRQVTGAGNTGSTAKPNKRSNRKRIRMAAAIVMALSVWAGAKAWGQMEKFEEKAVRMDALEAKLEETQQVNESLKREIERLSDLEYREERMRKDMHLSKDGETVFDVPRVKP